MRLTIEEHPEAIKRYRHLRPARGRKARGCGALGPLGRRTCTREREHSGPHAAHGRFRRVVAVWDSGPRARSPTKPVGPTTGVGGRARHQVARRGTRLPTRPSAGVWDWLWERFLQAFSSPMDLAFLIFFLAFVGFAVGWLRLLVG